MIKVGFILPQIHMAGPERWLIALLRHMDKSRFAFTGVALCPWSMEVPTLCREIARYAPIFAGPRQEDPFFHDAQSVQRMGSTEVAMNAALAEADIIVAWGTRKRLAEWTEPYRERGAQVVFLAHGNRSIDETFGHEEGATHFAAVSSQAVNFFAEENREQVTVIHNGVEIERCCPIQDRGTVRNGLGFTDNDVVLGHYGWLVPVKNPMAPIYAARVLRSPYAALVIGSGEMQDDVTRAMEDTDAPLIKTRWLPAVERPGDYLAAMDVCMVCSHEEPFSLVICEAMFAGVPVVATPAGVVEDLTSKFGPFVTQVGFHASAAELAEAARKAYGDKSQTHYAREIAWQYLSASAMSNRWEKYFDRILREMTQ